MKNFIFQPYHLVTFSPWPLMISLNLWFLMMGIIKMFNFNMKTLFELSLLSLTICSMYWWKDIIRESTHQGFHSMNVINGLYMSMILFITSEIFFFFSFFWSYFHMFLSPSMEIGMTWPPFMLKNLINPYELPLLNTIILVSSGMFLSMAHYSILKKNMFMSNLMMFITILFGIIFTMCQMYEYIMIPFTINNSNYGTTFFMMTGFHGIHVIIGTIFILTTYLRLMINHLSNIHHSSFEMSAWYWHFVDVVWLFLFLFIYWWTF